ncbi:hypothetical protein [Xanthomonas arboricola]|uniref:hypothetical protein n=1 Tax=Xanthomonas arboricola TaxID=56448 RepID=UPI000CEE10DE|nr:hypothetical protein [Xanthomonas arboricola]PPU42073.1 hypothetical protein XaplCFBP3123_02805 [Xanthomonas arboricola pv. populi]
MPAEDAGWHRAHDMSAMLQLYGKRADAHMAAAAQPHSLWRVQRISRRHAIVVVVARQAGIDS